VERAAAEYRDGVESDFEIGGPAMGAEAGGGMSVAKRNSE